MFRNLAVSLFENEMIKTTLARAKELRRVVEPLITLSKSDSVSCRRQAFSTLRNKDSVKSYLIQSDQNILIDLVGIREF